MDLEVIQIRQAFLEQAKSFMRFQEPRRRDSSSIPSAFFHEVECGNGTSLKMRRIVHDVFSRLFDRPAIMRVLNFPYSSRSQYERQLHDRKYAFEIRDSLANDAVSKLICTL